MGLNATTLIRFKRQFIQPPHIHSASKMYDKRFIKPKFTYFTTPPNHHLIAGQLINAIKTTILFTFRCPIKSRRFFFKLFISSKFLSLSFLNLKTTFLFHDNFFHHLSVCVSFAVFSQFPVSTFKVCFPKKKIYLNEEIRFEHFQPSTWLVQVNGYQTDHLYFE